jgi:FkbM family methyltransferase
MIDVGAHFGSSLKPFLESGWEVWAFEPDPTKHARLQELARFGALRLFPTALSDHGDPGKPFFTSPVSTGIASLVPFHPSHTPAGIVQVSTLRDELTGMPQRRVDYLKIDAEGSDFAVLRGFPWDSHPSPVVILAEFDELKTRRQGHSHREIGNFLLDRNYTVWLSEWFPVVKYGATHAWRHIRSFPAALEHPDAWGNFLAVHASGDPEAMARIVKMAGTQAA